MEFKNQRLAVNRSRLANDGSWIGHGLGHWLATDWPLTDH